MASQKIEIPKGDTRIITATLTDSNGAALDLSTMTTAYLSVRKDKSASDTTVQDCETDWAELTMAGVTRSLDSVDFKKGSSSLQLIVDDTVAAGTKLASALISSTNLTDHTSVHIWLKSTVATVSGDLQIMIDGTAACASPLKFLDVPILAPATWKRCVLDLGDPRDLGAIISVGIKYVTDLGACTLHIDDVIGAKYIVEKTAGSVVGLPTAGIAAFTITPAKTLYMSAGEWDYDVEVTFASGVVYSPIIAKFEILDDVTTPD